MKKIILALLMMISIPARAQDVHGLFCPALAQDKTYGGKYDSYRKLIPGQDGWIFRSEKDFKNSFTGDDISTRQLLTLQKVLDAQGVSLVILYTPTRGMMHPKEAGFDAGKAWQDYDAFIADMQKRGVRMVGLKKTAPDNSFFYKRDHHWNVNGAKVAAQALADVIRRLPVYKELQKTEFTTQAQTPMAYIGTFAKMFKKICGTNVPPEIITPEKTVPKQAAQNSNDLFGEAEEPQVVLAGTSNSMAQYEANFAGALKQDLSADVLNVSMAGAGVDDPMLEYLKSDHFQTHKAKVLIWEVPGYYDFKTLRSFLREAAPMVAGDCAAPVQQADIVLKPGVQNLFDNLAAQKIAGSDYYVSLQWPVKTPASFTLGFDYKDAKESFKLQNKTGQAFAGLSNRKKTDLEDITIDVPQALAGVRMSAHLCKL